MKNFVGQCVKYDIMLNHKYSFDDLRNSTDIWGLVTSNPSKNRGIFWIPVDGTGRAQYVTCEGAVAKFNAVWTKELERISFFASKRMFSGRAIGHSNHEGHHRSIGLCVFYLYNSALHDPTRLPIFV